MGPLDKLSADLGKVIAEATAKAVNKTNAKAFIDAAATGGEAAVRRLAEGMTTEELQRVARELSR